MSWASVEQARRYWPESTTVDPVVLGELLDASTARLVPYGPAPAVVDVPLGHVIANVYDARNLYAARLVDGIDGDEVGIADYVARQRRGPSQQVRELLRPTRPAVFR